MGLARFVALLSGRGLGETLCLVELLSSPPPAMAMAVIAWVYDRLVSTI